MLPVQCEEWRINHLTLLLVLPYACWLLCRHIILRTSSDIFISNLGLRFEGLFWEKCILKGQITFEGHWRLQSWTLTLIKACGAYVVTVIDWISSFWVVYENAHHQDTCYDETLDYVLKLYWLSQIQMLGQLNEYCDHWTKTKKKNMKKKSLFWDLNSDFETWNGILCDSWFVIRMKQFLI